jgi:hypothetical protein
MRLHVWSQPVKLAFLQECGIGQVEGKRKAALDYLGHHTTYCGYVRLKHPSEPSYSGLNAKDLGSMFQTMLYRVYTVSQLVEALRYIQKVTGSISRWGHWNLSLTYLSGHTVALGLTQRLTKLPGASREGKGVRFVGLTILAPSCADYLKVLGAANSYKPTVLCRPV